MMNEETAVVTLTKMMARKASLIEEIHTQKKDIYNIQLQLDRRANETDADTVQWRARATYSKNMKEADLAKMEGLLDIINKSLEEPPESSDQNTMVAQEFVKAAKRRLEPTVYISIMDEATEIVQDAMYEVVESVNYNSQNMVANQ